MKTTALMLALSLGFGILHAQDDKKPNEKVTIRVQVSEEKDGKTSVTRRTYHYDHLSEAEREAKVKSIIDSLKSDDSKVVNRHLSVEVEEGDARLRKDSSDGEVVIIDPKNKKHIYRYEPNQNFEFKNKDNFSFDFDTRGWADAMSRNRKEWEPQLKKFKQDFRTFNDEFSTSLNHAFGGNSSNKPSTVRGLDAYANNPEKNELNVRFYAPEKGDVTVVVTDTKGKQVAKKEVKDFSGNFVGQLDLGKNAKGTYFITVTQGDDGAVKRFVVE
jgi:Secretion system C-terminal sorting domain